MHCYIMVLCIRQNWVSGWFSISHTHSILCIFQFIFPLPLCLVSCIFTVFCLHFGIRLTVSLQRVLACMCIQGCVIDRGSAISLAMTYYIVLFLLLAYIRGSGIYRQTWAGMLACLFLCNIHSVLSTTSMYGV